MVNTPHTNGPMHKCYHCKHGTHITALSGSNIRVVQSIAVSKKEQAYLLTIIQYNEKPMVLSLFLINKPRTLSLLDQYL